PFREHDVIVTQYFLRPFTRVPDAGAVNVKRQPTPSARLARCPQVIILLRVIAQHGCATRCCRQRRTRHEPFEIDKLRNDLCSLFRHSALTDELVVTRIIDGDIAQYARETRWIIFVEIPIVTEIKGGGVWEMQ